MNDENRPERLNQEGFAAYAERAKGDDQPVTMLNLLALKPDGGRARYEEYMAAVAPLVQKLGGRVVYLGAPDVALLGDGSWDLVLIVEYPTRAAFLDMIGSPEYQAIGHLRTEALTKGELHPMETIAISG